MKVMRIGKSTGAGANFKIMTSFLPAKGSSIIFNVEDKT